MNFVRKSGVVELDSEGREVVGKPDENSNKVVVRIAGMQ
jgi:hypothetical protein